MPADLFQIEMYQIMVARGIEKDYYEHDFWPLTWLKQGDTYASGQVLAYILTSLHQKTCKSHL